jgi:hypothetical protein
MLIELAVGKDDEATSHCARPAGAAAYKSHATSVLTRAMHIAFDQPRSNEI